MFQKTLLVAFAIIGLSQGGSKKLREISPSDTEKDESNSYPKPYILGGETVEGREFPGLGSVHRGGFPFCAGSILNAEWVLTTSSCMFVQGANLYYVLVGTNQLDNGGTPHPVKEVIYHEGYNESDSWINDIALLRLQNPIVFGEGLVPVQLPEKGEETPIGTIGSIAGWGQIDHTISTTNDLQKLELEIYDHEKCREAYNVIDKNIYQSQICGVTAKAWAGPGFGDSADPFIVDGKLIGLLSWERYDNGIQNPVVMTKVSDYIDWINEHITG